MLCALYLDYAHSCAVGGLGLETKNSAQSTSAHVSRYLLCQVLIFFRFVGK